MSTPTSQQQRRPRRGSVERPINGRMYRSAWLIVAFPLLISALSVYRPSPLPEPTLPETFNRQSAVALAEELDADYPDRTPGSPFALGAARWFRTQLTPFQAQGAFQIASDRFRARVPGLGTVSLVNVMAVVTGRSPDDAVVVIAHRDNAGASSGVNDNATGTAALVELARTYGNARGGPAQSRPAHTLVFLSTDGGAYGGIGARRFLKRPPFDGRILAAIVLDSIAGSGPPRLELAGDSPRSPNPKFVQTLAERLREKYGRLPQRTSAVGQLIDLGLPYSLYEQAPFVGRGIPAATITTAGDRHVPGNDVAADRINQARFTQIGRATQLALTKLDEGPELTGGTSSFVWLGGRLIRGWTIQLALIAALVPFLVASVDLFARCRRRGIPLRPALRAYRARLGYWLLVAALFELFRLFGAWPDGTAAPIAPQTGAAGHWPVLALGALTLLAVLAWLPAREPLLPRRPASPEDELAGYTAALLALGLLSLFVVALNAYALVFLLPSLHAWLFLPQVRDRPAAVRSAVLAAGLSGPLLVVVSLATRFGLGLDAPWYLLALFGVGYLPISVLAALVAWTAAGAQLASLTSRRYAPYPSRRERGPRGPVREVVRRIILAILRLRRRRALSEPARRALEA